LFAWPIVVLMGTAGGALAVAAESRLPTEGTTEAASL
jgi:acetyl-CoA carboxylase alpha subunit